MHYTEITAKIIGKCHLNGKTPNQTVRSCLATDARFKRVAEGKYALAEWDQYPTARFAKDIAYDVLKSRRRPMLLLSLGKAVLEERMFIGGPNQVARNVIRSDKRFYYDAESDLVGLVEWKNSK